MMKETMKVFVLIYNDDICGVFDTEEKAEAGKTRHIEKHPNWYHKYDNYSIKQYAITKPINNKVYYLINCDTDKIYNVYGLEEEMDSDCWSVDFDPCYDEIKLNEIN